MNVLLPYSRFDVEKIFRVNTNFADEGRCIHFFLEKNKSVDLKIEIKEFEEDMHIRYTLLILHHTINV